MKQFILFFLAFSALAFGQAPEKHPRVIDVEEKLRDEASRYFSRRYPGEAFYVRVDVTPLRRITKENERAESLPYFDSVSEEEMDEWDDPTTPLSFLRHRVTKVFLELSVPEKFSDEKIATMKDELQVYLKLLPYRDEVRIEKKLKSPEVPLLPPYFYPVAGGILFSVILLGLILRWSIGSSKSAPVSAATAPAAASAPVSREPARASTRSSTDVRGDVTFHDPLKLMDIISSKLSLIEKSGTFPTLKDMLALENSEALASIVHVFPDRIQRELFFLTSGTRWLEAFAEGAAVTHDTLSVLDRVSRERTYSSPDRNWENLLIQVWRMGEKSVPFFRKISQDEAFAVFNYLPKSIALNIAKKTFPGTWGRLLDTKAPVIAISPETIRSWSKELLLLHPASDWKLLEEFKKDREILAYLDKATIDEEKDIYESLSSESFVFQVRPPFYRIFEMKDEEFARFVSTFPVDKWALVVVNSSRTYIKAVSDQLEDKKKVVFSNHLRTLDQHISRSEQIHWRKLMAEASAEFFTNDLSILKSETEKDAHAKTA